MKAMILAAGVGSRLRPLTDEVPKALIPVGGVPMLERVLVRLKDAGASAVVVNAHHHADKVAAFCADLARRYGLRVAVSREDALLLETGGGLKKAAPFFDDGKPFLVHNADVLTDLDLEALLRAHRESGAVATLACRRRETSRRLLFDGGGLLCGREGEGRIEWASGPIAGAETLAYDGVAAYSPAFLAALIEEGVFSLTRPWLRLAGLGHPIRAFRSDAWSWHDIGSPEKLAAAQAWAAGRP